jgi:hypothetical protein
MGGRTNIAQCRMTALPIIEGFNVKENVGASLGAGFIQDMMDMFCFEGSIIMPHCDCAFFFMVRKLASNFGSLRTNNRS